MNPDQFSSDTTLMRDESFIIVRKHESETEISISGLANINASAWQMPPFGKESGMQPFLQRSCYRIYLISLITEANETMGISGFLVQTKI